MDKNYRMSKSLKKMIALMRVGGEQRRLLAEADAYYDVRRRSTPIKREPREPEVVIPVPIK